MLNPRRILIKFTSNWHQILIKSTSNPFVNLTSKSLSKSSLNPYWTLIKSTLNSHQIDVESSSNRHRILYRFDVKILIKINIETLSNRRQIHVESMSNPHRIDIESLSIWRQNPHRNPRQIDIEPLSNSYRFDKDLTSNPHRFDAESSSNQRQTYRRRFDIEPIKLRSLIRCRLETLNRYRIDIAYTYWNSAKYGIANSSARYGSFSS